MPISDRQLFAAIDLGSNSFHMLIATIKAQQIYPVDRVKKMVRLAGGLDKNKNITSTAMDRAFDCLKTFAQRMTDIPDEHIRIVGTNTLRVAKNSPSFIQQAEQILDHEIEIISGREEARMLYLGVAQSIPNDKNKRLVIDIGGGSTELIIGRGFKPLLRESLFMGCVSITKRFFADGKINQFNWHHAVTHAQQQIAPILKDYKKANWKNCIGASGTFRATAAILEANKMGLSGITAENLHLLIEKCLQFGHIEKLTHLPGLSEQRREVYIGGLAIIDALFSSFNIQSSFISNGALREGLIYEMHDDGYEHVDVKKRSVKKIASQFDVDHQQTHNVKAMANLVTQHGQGSLQLGKLQKELLNYAITLHEIGLSIAHNQYHKHGAYIIRHADMPGFSKQHQLFISLLIRQHRRKLSKSIFLEISQRHRKGLLPLIIIFRLAVIFCRDRRAHTVLINHLEWNENSLKIIFNPQWLDQHPLIQADLKDEIKRLKHLPFELSIA